MRWLGPTQFASPTMLAIAAVLGLAAVVVTVARRTDLPRWSRIYWRWGCALLVLAAGNPTWLLPTEKSVSVMVDLSPSTRGAGSRDRDALRRR